MKRTLTTMTASLFALALLSPVASGQMQRRASRGVMQTPNNNRPTNPDDMDRAPANPAPSAGTYAPPSNGGTAVPAQPAPTAPRAPRPPAGSGGILDTPDVRPIEPNGTWSHTPGEDRWIPFGPNSRPPSGTGNPGNAPAPRPRAPDATPAPTAPNGPAGQAPGTSGGGFVPQYPNGGSGFTPQYPGTGGGFVPQSPGSGSGQAPATTTIGGGPNGGGVTIQRVPGQAIPWVQVNPVDVKPLHNNGTSWFSNDRAEPRPPAPSNADAGGRRVLAPSNATLPDNAPGDRTPTAAAKFRR